VRACNAPRRAAPRMKPGGRVRHLVVASVEGCPSAPEAARGAHPAAQQPAVRGEGVRRECRGERQPLRHPWALGVCEPCRSSARPHGAPACLLAIRPLPVGARVSLAGPARAVAARRGGRRGGGRRERRGGVLQREEEEGCDGVRRHEL